MTDGEETPKNLLGLHHKVYASAKNFVGLVPSYRGFVYHFMPRIDALCFSMFYFLVIHLNDVWLRIMIEKTQLQMVQLSQYCYQFSANNIGFAINSEIKCIYLFKAVSDSNGGLSIPSLLTVLVG